MPVKITFGKEQMPGDKPTAVQLFCKSCGSTNVGAECCSYWNTQGQCWEAGDAYDDRTCHDCGVEGKSVLEEMPLADWVAMGEPEKIPGYGADDDGHD